MGLNLYPWFGQSLNFVRFGADVIHLFAMVFLLVRIVKSKSCTGISGKTQLLMAVIFTSRYLDLFDRFFSYYNTAMKITFLAITYVTVYLIYIKHKSSYDREHDVFALELLLIPVSLLALFYNHWNTPKEILWTFSMYLEAVAILPQILFTIRSKEYNSTVLKYVSLLALYKTMHVLSWVYRYFDQHYWDHISTTPGIIQTLILYAAVLMISRREFVESGGSCVTHRVKDCMAKLSGRNAGAGHNKEETDFVTEAFTV